MTGLLRRIRADVRRSVLLFTSFRTEQTDPVGFYRLIAEDAVALIERIRPLEGATVLDVGEKGAF